MSPAAIIRRKVLSHAVSLLFRVHPLPRYSESLAHKNRRCGGTARDESHYGPFPGTQLDWDDRGTSADLERLGAPDSPAKWSILLDEVLAPILRQWQEGGLRSVRSFADRRNRLPNQGADKE